MIADVAPREPAESDDGEMPVKSPKKTTALTAFFTLLLAACSNDSACDRDCLIDLTNSYLAALVARDPSAVPLAPDIAFVENIKRMKPGEGLWTNAVSGPTDFAIYVPDVVQQQAGFMGVMEREGENGDQAVLLAVRLKLEHGQITEAEHLIAPVNADNMQRLQKPRPGLLSEVPAGNRKDHDELAKIGLSYYDALDDNDGSLMPFADDCERHAPQDEPAHHREGRRQHRARSGAALRRRAPVLSSGLAGLRMASIELPALSSNQENVFRHL